jgi:hypothetical protein
MKYSVRHACNMSKWEFRVTIQCQGAGGRNGSITGARPVACLVWIFRVDCMGKIPGLKSLSFGIASHWSLLILIRWLEGFKSRVSADHQKRHNLMCDGSSRSREPVGVHAAQLPAFFHPMAASRTVFSIPRCRFQLTRDRRCENILRSGRSLSTVESACLR